MPKCITCKQNVSISCYDLISGHCLDCLTKHSAAQEKQAALKKAEFNPPPDAQCYLFMRGDQSGPFLPAQIRAMWRAGSITSDALFSYKGLPDWRPAKSFCDSMNSGSDTFTKLLDNDARQGLGAFLAVIGIIIAVYFIAVYDVSVRTESRYISGIGTVGGDSVVNLAKQQNRLFGVIVGLALTAAGVVIIFLPTNSNRT